MEQSDTVNNFKKKVIRFMVRGNDFYGIIKMTLGIEDLLDELNNGLDALPTLIDIKDGRQSKS
ncbi:hypothetical protein ACQKOM_21945 [Peribacillus frigoritolerans]|uniref:hypothetical protein n=1 Tax=Peribacillus frigoritolerans TaxID=450367 RepID=UPI003CFC02F0